MELGSNERKIITALQALKQDPKLIIRAASRIYEIPRTTLIHRRDGKQSGRDISAISKNLTDLEENAILE